MRSVGWNGDPTCQMQILNILRLQAFYYLLTAEIRAWWTFRFERALPFRDMNTELVTPKIE